MVHYVRGKNCIILTVGDRFMLYWMKPLPETKIEDDFRPFIKNEWFRTHFMWFVYALQLILIFLSIIIGAWNFPSIFQKLLIFIIVYLIHELFHIVVIYRIGNISLTHSGIFFWINSDAKMSKARFWLFMTLPFLLLTIVPCIIMHWVNGEMFPYLQYVAWINAIIAGADIINSVLILIKPRKSIFYRGYYK